MTSESKTDLNNDESMASAAGAAKKADRAVRDTAQRYLNRVGINFDLQQVEKTICDKPLGSAAIAAAAGFIVGGGMVTRLGYAMLALLGRKAARETAMNTLSGMVR